MCSSGRVLAAPRTYSSGTHYVVLKVGAEGRDPGQSRGWGSELTFSLSCLPVQWPRARGDVASLLGCPTAPVTREMVRVSLLDPKDRGPAGFTCQVFSSGFWKGDIAWIMYYKSCQQGPGKIALTQICYFIRKTRLLKVRWSTEVISGLMRIQFRFCCQLNYEISFGV